jgi:hypothetical protein
MVQEFNSVLRSSFFVSLYAFFESNLKMSVDLVLAI